MMTSYEWSLWWLLSCNGCRQSENQPSVAVAMVKVEDSLDVAPVTRGRASDGNPLPKSIPKTSPKVVRRDLATEIGQLPPLNFFEVYIGGELPEVSGSF